MAEERFNPDKWYETDDKGNKTFNPSNMNVRNISKDDYGQVLDLFDKEMDYSKRDTDIRLDHNIISNLMGIYNLSDNESIKSRALEKYQSYLDCVARTADKNKDKYHYYEIFQAVRATQGIRRIYNYSQSFENRANTLLDEYYAKAMENPEYFKDFEKTRNRDEFTKPYFEAAKKRYEEAHAQSQTQENQNTSEATPSNPKDPLKEAQNAAIAELKELQAERGWNDEALKEHISKINELTSLEAIQTYLEKQKNQDSSQEGERNSASQGENAELTSEERKKARENTVPTDEFKEFINKTYGDNAYEEKYVNGTDKEKDNLEIQYETQEGLSPLRKAKRSTVNEVKHDSETENTNDDWKKLRREEWEKYANQERQEFKLLSEDKAPDLNMSVGGTSINYANEHEVTMANTDEYSKFVKLIEIEKKAHTDVINFGEIQSEDYRSKLAAACLQVGLEMKKGPKHIDLSLDCFKNLDDATKQKIEAYNQEQAAKEQSNQSEQGNESKPEPTADGNGNSNGEGNESKPEPTAADTKNKTKEEYQKLYEAKLTELKAKKEKGESVDFSSIKDPVDRILTYAAAKENKLKIENLNNNEFLIDKRQHGDRQGDITTTLNALPEEAFKQVDLHEKRVKSLRKIKRMIKNGELNEGEYYEARRVKDADGKDKLDENGQPIYELDENGNKIYDRKKSQLNTYKDGKQTKINREDVKYTKDKDGRRQYQYTVDEQTKLRIYQEKQNGGR